MARSTLIRPHRRSCPLCGHHGFACLGVDYFGNPEFECNQCRHVWSKERGPRKGTSRDRRAALAERKP